MGRYYETSETVEVDVEVDLYEALDEWDDEDFRIYFKKRNRSVLEDDDVFIPYNDLPWLIATGKVDKKRLLTILEGII